ncbi:MAG: NUDIX domain-containing protein [Clostridia bacterium]|nr:NUDIX domain-containing protein [Clostridia bacterium]
MNYYEQKAKIAYELYLKGLPFKKVYATVQKGDKFVVLKHEEGKYKYSLSGGGVDPGEDNVTAIKREILEELNINIKVVKSLGIAKYVRTWHYNGKHFDVDYEAEIFHTKFASYGENKNFGLEGEFTTKKISIDEISKEEMLANVAEFVTFGIKFE